MSNNGTYYEDIGEKQIIDLATDLTLGKQRN